MTTPTLGILGGGQLAWMLARAASTLGVDTRVLDPNPDCSAARTSTVIAGAYDDRDALARLADGCNALTYEFENVPVESARFVETIAPVRPAPIALEIAQDRLNERTLFAELGIDTPTFATVDSLDELRDALSRFAPPALLKARRLGYDGKGQALVGKPDDAEGAWDAIGRTPAILDAFVPFTRELSVVAVRTVAGETRAWPLTQNTHRGGILRLSIAPAPDVPDHLAQAAHDAASRIMDRLGYVGVMAVEFFQVGSGSDARLLANEIAPRVHNSGHWTIEGAATSQFENHVRAVLGMPLGPTDAVGHSAMVNVIGDMPRPGAAASVEGAVLHDYAKSPRPGRKLAHVTINARDEATLRARLEHFTRIVG